MDQLKELRIQIDKIDRQIISSLIERKKLVAHVAEHKIKNGLPIKNRDRERELITAKISLAQGELEAEFVQKVFRLIIEHSCQLQEKLFKKII